MLIGELSKRIAGFQNNPKPSDLATILDGIVDSLLSGSISYNQAFRMQHKIENTSSTPKVGCNVLRAAHMLWEAIEWAADVICNDSQEGASDYPILELQNVLTEINYEIFRLRDVGWENVFPYMRAYYERFSGEKIIASTSLTAYEEQNVLCTYDANNSLHQFFSKLVSEANTLEQLEQQVPATFKDWQLRNISRGYSLASDFTGSI